MEVYFSTVIRDEPLDQGGEFVWMDWESNRIMQRVPVEDMCLHFQNIRVCVHGLKAVNG